MFILISSIIILIIYLFHLLLIDNNKSNNSFTIDFKRAYYKNIQIDESFIEPVTSYKSGEIKSKYKIKERKTYIGKNGYIHFSDSNKLVHRWVMEKSLGRKLSSKEVVHHIDGNKLNNKIKNLKLFPCQKEHDRHHRENLKNYGTWYEKIPEYISYKKYPKYAKQY